MDEETHSLLGPSREDLTSTKVFPLLPHLKKDVMNSIDAALTWNQLTAADIDFATVRPLVLKYARLHNLAAPYAALVVRSHFLTLSSSNMAHHSLMASRAALCELLAMRLLRHFAANKLELVAVLTTGWNPLAGAPPEVAAEVRDILRDGPLNDPTSALEMAISTKSKHFLSSPLAQTVVKSIYTGNIVFSTASHRGVIADNYKPRPIEIYDCRTAPFLDHYRLRVPRYNAILEFLNFAVLLGVFTLCISNRNFERMELTEIMFVVCAFGFALAEYTVSSNGGWSLYIMNMWNVFDTSFISIFLVYFVLRIQGLATHDVWISELAFNILSCGACILFPRLAFFAVSNNVVVLALRGMIFEFIIFITIAAICFSGLLFTLWTLGSKTWSVGAIAWLMVQIWFGNTSLSFLQAKSFHPVFGPVLMTVFAALSNTLLLTILISILSSTFVRIDANATQEYLFQFTITTIENVKSDALFSYQPPFNLLAYAILWPASRVLSPRALHSLNVFLIKVTSFPILICIGIYERFLRRGQRIRERSRDAAYNVYLSLPRQLKNVPVIAAMGHKSHLLYEAIFDVRLSEEYELFEEGEEGEEERVGENGQVGENGADAQVGEEEHFQVIPSTPTSSSNPLTIGQGSGMAIHFPINTTTARRVSLSLSVPPSPRRRKVSAPLPYSAHPSTATSTSTALFSTPLSKLFTASTARPPSILEETLSSSAADSAAAVSAMNKSGEDLNAAVKRMEGFVESIQNLPVQKLKEEMKELQERQARIENLLMMLTRGMRNDPGLSPPRRESTAS